MAITKVSNELVNDGWAIKLLEDYFDEVKEMDSDILQTTYFVEKKELDLSKDKEIFISAVKYDDGRIVIHSIDDIIINPLKPSDN